MQVMGDATPSGAPSPNRTGVVDYMQSCRSLVLDELRAIIPQTHADGRTLYRLMLEYPLREAKALRPALCIAACRAAGGDLQAVLRSAAVLELYHNAFLIHDDIEDASLLRRGAPTLHQEYGVPIAINVGDAMFALALQPLLDNTALLGLGKALRILEAIARMVSESVEGQALELEWIRSARWDLSDDDYTEMVLKKTGWYSFITPVRVGLIAADVPPESIAHYEEYARCLAIAFQIQDDLLNLDAGAHAYGKEPLGDLWEGKRTLILLHALHHASPAERARAEEILRRPRPAGEVDGSFAALLVRLLESGDLSEHGRDALLTRLPGGENLRPKTQADVEALLATVERHGGRTHARTIATGWARSALAALEVCAADLGPSTHRDFLFSLPRYVLERLQ